MLLRQEIFLLVYGQLDESSRCEIKDHVDWITKSEEKDLLYLVTRIRATHIAKQSGIADLDEERVRATWGAM